MVSQVQSTFRISKKMATNILIVDIVILSLLQLDLFSTADETCNCENRSPLTSFLKLPMKYERVFKIMTNGLYSFEVSFFVSEVLEFLCYAN